MIESDVLELLERYSNRGRWGAADERGTVNFVTPAVTLAALATIRQGICVSIGRDVPLGSASLPPPAVHQMTYAGPSSFFAQDTITLATHGWEATHVDSVSHASFDGNLYNGRHVADHVTATGLTFGAITGLAEGVVTRGVLLDVAAARGAEFLEVDDGITSADLDLAAERAGVAVRSGDAIFVRSGHELRIRGRGPEPYERRQGVLPDVLPWLHQKEVAIYSGDCVERLPTGYPRLPMWLHQIGQAAMGLTLLDLPDVERLAEACRSYGRAEFALVVAPLRIPGGTGSHVNPLAIF